LGKTQEQVAEIIGVKQPWISKLESCCNDHIIESLARYIFALGGEIVISAAFGEGVSIELASSKPKGEKIQHRKLA
jgi:transcriptional regulator with XRE-family HTH domain